MLLLDLSTINIAIVDANGTSDDATNHFNVASASDSDVHVSIAIVVIFFIHPNFNLSSAAINASITSFYTTNADDMKTFLVALSTTFYYQTCHESNLAATSNDTETIISASTTNSSYLAITIFISITINITVAVDIATIAMIVIAAVIIAVYFSASQIIKTLMMHTNVTITITICLLFFYC